MGTLDELTPYFQDDGLSEPLKNSENKQWIAKILERIHARIPAKKINTTEAACIALDREEIFQGINYKKAVIFLMSTGCEWALSDAHGCTMCGHLAKQTRKNKHISAHDHIAQFEREFKRIDYKEYPLLNLFNNGSFLNENEIAARARSEILTMINHNPDIKMVVLESRPEYVTEDKVKEIKKLLSNKHVEIAIGLELKDDIYRSVCFNKGFSLKNYNEAAGIIVKHLHLRTYVFLKPPFLTERESIEQAIETVHHAFAAGSTTVSLEAGTIQGFTLAEHLYHEGLYTPPWLWSIKEVVMQCREYNGLIIGLFKFYPSPTAVPYNCPNCSEAVIEAIRTYNKTLKVDVFNGLDCTCKEKWKEVINKTPLPFGNRLEMALTNLKKSVGLANDQ